MKNYLMKIGWFLYFVFFCYVLYSISVDLFLYGLKNLVIGMVCIIGIILVSVMTERSRKGLGWLMGISMITILVLYFVLIMPLPEFRYN